MAAFKQLTDRQREVLEFIRDKIDNRGYGPTVREIGDQFEIRSPNGVMCHLKALEKKGIITREANRSRAIQLTDLARADQGLPLAGRIAAGVMHLAVEQDERFDFDSLFSKGKKSLFVLEVSGESMIDAQIADGDYVIVRKQRTAQSGQMVVANTEDGEATLKYWFPEKNRVRLQPANANMDPIYTRDARVQGVVVGVVRKVD